MGSSPETEHPVKAFGYAARDSSGLLSPFNFSRRETGDEDVRFKVLYCGVCHSDLHSIKNDWLNAKYPMIPGHEIVGVVTEVGSKVKKVKVGDKVGVGCMVGSCRSCDQCVDDQEQYCSKSVLTYNSSAAVTYGGYSDHMVTVISTNLKKKEEAISKLGADSFLVSSDQPQMQAAVSTMDGIIDTVSADHPLTPLISILKPNGKLVLVGAPTKPHEVPAFLLLFGRKLVGGSLIGGIKETQEMIEFAANHKITAAIELIPIDYINTAMERLQKSDVRYRFVIDIANSLKST
ncbi:hypothetical protein M8C21_024682 [Ambrosia artemisiifolia]|uniref:Enoyl reductase (ER) domain-containing protein n=1 Tax=Ambrosia artemisiifolia TaxID=4212 RepID=A0AAD5GGG9_AMBAR|nr:hypothetical protein M8C21_024682 [Ambrosia artemisiifolia]